MGFSTIDYLVLVAYLAGITVFGVMFRKSQRTVKDYFLGDKNTSWIVISLSIVATETSTLTLIGVPALAFANYARPEQGGNFTYLQVVLGYVVARIIISFLFIPAYFRGNLLTAYELLKNRFGVQAKNFAASLFLIMRALAEGVRVFAAYAIAAFFKFACSCDRSNAFFAMVVARAQLPNMASRVASISISWAIASVASEPRIKSSARSLSRSASANCP